MQNVLTDFLIVTEKKKKDKRATKLNYYYKFSKRFRVTVTER